jgi:hypothetical protein
MPYNTDAKWRREEDDYFRQIGLLDRLMKDPVAAYGADRLRMPPGGAINMGGSPGKTGALQNYGDYTFYPGSEDPGKLQVGVGLPQDRYAGVMAHELGHAGSRWLNDGLYPDGPAADEMRQRVADLEMNTPDSPMGIDASKAIDRWYGGLANPDVRDAFKKNIEMAAEAKRRLKRLKEATRLRRQASSGEKTDKEN